MANQHGGASDLAVEEGEEVGGVVVQAVAVGSPVGAAVTAQIESVDMPARGEHRDDGEEALPVRGAAVDHDEGWAGVGTLGVVERDLTGVEAVLVEHARWVPSSVEAITGVEARKGSQWLCRLALRLSPHQEPQNPTPTGPIQFLCMRGVRV